MLKGKALFASEGLLFGWWAAKAVITLPEDVALAAPGGRWGRRKWDWLFVWCVWVTLLLPLLNDSQWTPRDAPSHLFWMHARVLMCLWGDDGVRLIEYQLALWFFSVLLLFFASIFQVFSWICGKSLWKMKPPTSFPSGSLNWDTTSNFICSYTWRIRGKYGWHWLSGVSS